MLQILISLVKSIMKTNVTFAEFEINIIIVLIYYSTHCSRTVYTDSEKVSSISSNDVS